jgi:hypothetical protein
VKISYDGVPLTKQMRDERMGGLRTEKEWAEASLRQFEPEADRKRRLANDSGRVLDIIEAEREEDRVRGFRERIEHIDAELAALKRAHVLSREEYTEREAQRNPYSVPAPPSAVAFPRGGE